MEEEVQPISGDGLAGQVPIQSPRASAPSGQLGITIWAYWIAGIIARDTKDAHKVLGGHPVRGLMGEAAHALLKRQENGSQTSELEQRLLKLLQTARERRGGATSMAQEPNKAAIMNFLREREEALWLNYRITRNLLRLHRHNPAWASVAKAKSILKEATDGSGAATAGYAKVKSAWVSHKDAAHFIYACFSSGVRPEDLLRPTKKIDGRPLPIHRMISVADAVRSELLGIKAKHASPGATFRPDAMVPPQNALFAKLVPVAVLGVGAGSRITEPELTPGEISRLTKDVGSAGRTTGSRRRRPG